MKTIKKQIKLIMLLLVLIVGTNIYAQKETAKNRIFVRVYNLEGKKINKGHVVFVGDTLLGLKRNGKFIEINIRNIGIIKTKRSAGNNILIGSAIGASSMAIIGASDKNGWFTTSETAALYGIIIGLPAGATIGGITALFKKSETYIIDGNQSKWDIFKAIFTKTKE
ncbi:hypothetical protein ACS386_04840 [Flavobacteriaceae bacterium LMO-SS05]